jgi:hypothetical protein
MNGPVGARDKKTRVLPAGLRGGGLFQLSSIIDESLPGCSTRGRLIVSNKHVGVPSRITAALPKARGRGGNFGRPARLRIAKSSISKRSFSFQKPIDLRVESAIFRGHHRVHDRRVKTSSF